MSNIKRRYQFSWINVVITWLIVPSILLLLWISFSIFFTSKYSLTVIAIPHDRNDFVLFKTSELLANQKVVARFESNENNLGIVSVRFYNFRQISEDSVVFRMKEVGQKEWFYENTYAVDQFQPDELFTFGFPVISDSKGKQYVFEIESVRGEKGNAIALSNVNPPFVTQHQYPKDYLIENKGELFSFVFKKLYFSFTDKNFLIASFVYLLPLIFYLTLCWYVKIEIGIKKKPFPHPYLIIGDIMTGLLKSRYTLVHIFLLSVFFMILFMEEPNGLTTIILLLLWLWLLRLYRFNNTVSYALALFFLSICSVLLIFGQKGIAERSAIWAYYFLIIGTVQALIELRSRPKKSIGYKAFIENNLAAINDYWTNISKKVSRNS